MQVAAIPIMILGGMTVALAFRGLTPVTLDGYSAPKAILLFILFILPVHEMAHAFLHPGGGATDRTTIGVWPGRLLFFAHYDGPMSRNRFLAIFAAPLLLLSVAPLIIASVFEVQWWALGVVSFLNTVAASGDIIGIILLAAQVPRDAVVQNKGWRSYWRLAEVAELA
jgi:hypothetical protein